MNSKLSMHDRNNNKTDISQDSIEDMKAAFICVTKSLNEFLDSPDDLARGFNLL
jgi:hypothetical protein